MSPVKIHAIHTQIFHAQQNLTDFVLKSVTKDLISDGMILAVTSKIVSLAESRLVPKETITKRKLVEDEADHFLGEIGHGCFLTIKSGLFIASAGIDESNSESGQYILYPKNPYASAEILWTKLCQEWKIKNLGVILTDSHTSPLRQGVTGIALSYWGFSGVLNKIGSQDLFGRQLQMTKINVADGLAAAAVLSMGEGDECCPLAVIENAEKNVHLEFTASGDPHEIQMPLEEDLYYPVIKPLLQKKK